MLKQTDNSILATACIPWDRQGRFIESIFRRQIRQLHSAGLENLYIFGTAGEGYAVTDSLFRKIAGIFIEETKNFPGISQLGVIGLSTVQVRERIEIGLKLGYSHFQISLPPWGVLNDSETDRYFSDLLDAYPAASFLHYNTPRGGRVLTGNEYAHLKANHPNLTATKSSGHTVASLLALFDKAPAINHYVTELDYAAACLFDKSPGLLVSVGAVQPCRALDFFEAGRSGDYEKLHRMTADLNSIREKVIALVSRSGAHIDGAFDKLYARLLDPDFPLHLLSPYQFITEKEFEEFARWLNQELRE